MYKCYIFAFLVAFILNVSTTPLLIKLAHKNKWFDDEKDSRKIHTGKISRLGGIGIFVSSALSLILFFILFKSAHSEISYFSTEKIVLISISVINIFIAGILDDFTDMRARNKLFFQMICAALIIIAGIRIQNILIPFTNIIINFGVWSYPITFLWIIGVTNAVNLIDGLDGLSATICIFTASVYAFIFFMMGHFIVAGLSIIIAGSLVAYIIFNFPPARIFMGDSGSLTLGFILSVLPIIAEPNSGESLLYPIILLLIPIIDVFSAIIRRTRQGKHFFIPDKEHIHHKLLSHSLSEHKILTLISLIYIFSSFSCIYFFFETSVIRHIPYMINGIVVLVLFLFLHYNKKDLDF